MTLRKIFEKVETYNEIAEMMNTDKAQICFSDITICVPTCKRFNSFKELRKYVQREFISEIAYQIINSDKWELDGEVEIEWHGGVSKFRAELVAA